MEVNQKAFTAAGGAGPSGKRTIAANWKYVDIHWLVKVKTDSNGNVHYEVWRQPHNERTRLANDEQDDEEDEEQDEEPLRDVLTKPKILPVRIEFRVEERRNALKRYVLSAVMYQRLLDAVK